MECDICLVEWDSKIRIPRLLSCGHTFCQVCLIEILNKSLKTKKPFICPNCNIPQIQIKSENDFKLLIKNFNLLQIAEKLEERKTQTRNTNSSIFSFHSPETNHSKRNKDTSKKIKVVPVDPPKSKFVFDINRKCPKHNLIYHSYAVGTNLLFCDKCLENTKLSTFPLPNAINDLRQRLDSSQLKACIIKNQINQLKRFFESYLSEFEKENSQKIEELFKYFSKIIDYFHNSVKQLLSQCLSEQKTHINVYLDEMKNLNEQLTNIEYELTDIGNNPNSNYLLKNIDKIKKIENRMINFINYDLEFDLLSMKIGFNESEKNNLFESIQKSFYTQVEFFEIQNKLPNIKQILKINKTWPCICDEVNNNLNDIKCSSCGLFRRIETIEKFEKYENILKKRRETESMDFKDLYNEQKQNKNNNINKNFYVLDINWFNEWKNYIEKKNKKIPGPITNENLLIYDEKKNKFNTKEGLIFKKDYIIINEELWDFFFFNYNGGPFIEVLDDNHHKIEENLIKIDEEKYRSYSKIKEEFLDDENEINYENKLSKNDDNDDTPQNLENDENDIAYNISNAIIKEKKELNKKNLNEINNKK